MELAKLGLFPKAAAISAIVFNWAGAPLSSVAILPSKYVVVAFGASAADSADTLLLTASLDVCSEVNEAAIAPDTAAMDATRVEVSAAMSPLVAVFTTFSDANDTDPATTSDAMALTRVNVSVVSAVLRDASAALKLATTDTTAALTDPTALARTTVSVESAVLNTTFTSANDTDAALNAPDRDVTAVPRPLVSAERELIKPASTAESDGMAVLLSDATALMRALVSLDTAVFNTDTRDIVLALMVKLWFVLISAAIFSRVLNRDGAPLKMF
jgi:hypothetical protein